MVVWKRKWFSYEAIKTEENITVIRRLGFISYHLIKYIHGSYKLQCMANKPIISFRDREKADKK